MNKFLDGFFNDKMQAKNVIEIDVDQSALSKICDLSFEGEDYDVVSPGWNSDIKWISTNSIKSRQIFYDSFKNMNISSRVLQYLDLNESPVMYQGFIVSRSNCSLPYFHEDWIDTRNQAFTFLTPITNNSNGFGLLYHDIHGEVREYNYQMGKGILFGDEFIHSTKPGRSENPVMLLCFEFGTDKMEYWDAICQTVGYQGGLVQMPNKQFGRKNKNREFVTIPV